MILFYPINKDKVREPTKEAGTLVPADISQSSDCDTVYAPVVLHHRQKQYRIDVIIS